MARNNSDDIHEHDECTHQRYSSSIRQFLTQARSENDSPYRNNITLSRANVLLLIYPAVGNWLGSHTMAELSRCYAEHYPSEHWDINQYGDRFHELVAAQDQGPKADAYPWHVLGQVAQVEYALCQLYYSTSLPSKQLIEQSLEDATNSTILHLPDLSPNLLAMIKEHHPLMDSAILTPSSLDDDAHTICITRQNFRFIVFAEHPIQRLAR